jgi:hypothetical protein
LTPCRPNPVFQLIAAAALFAALMPWALPCRAQTATAPISAATSLAVLAPDASAATATAFATGTMSPMQPLTPMTVTPATATEPELLPAGAAPAMVTVQITGERIDESIFLPVAQSMIRENMRLESGAQYFISIKDKKYVDPPRPGGTGIFTVPVKIWGPGLRTVRQDVAVRLENLRVEGFGVPDRIYVSNSPESLTHSGELLNGDLAHGSATRFIIHHLNATRRPLNFVFFVENKNSSPALMRVVGDMLGVWNKELQSGHDATERFMKAHRDGVGYLLEVPPGGSVTLKKFAFKPGQIVSGLCEVQILRGHDVEFSVRVLEQHQPDQARHEAIGDFYSNRAHGHYSAPFISVNEEYVIGQRWKFLSIGHDALPPTIPNSPPLHGNYGVTYDINLNVVNPNGHRETVDITFAPAGGAAMGTFFINDLFKQTGIVKPPDKVTLYSFIVEPGTSQQVRLQTIPQSGSYYPVRLIVGSRIKGY